MKVIKNTYPEYPNVSHAEIGDTVHWRYGRQGFKLVRDSDGETLFTTAPVTSDGMLRSNNLPPILVGIIARIKSKNFILEIQ